MSGYHKSKEVYRHHRTIDNEPVIIPVRNLYISGQYLAPVYQDHNITITEMSSSNSLHIVDYTTKSENLYDPSGVELVDCNWTTTMSVIDYTSNSDTQYDSTIRLVDCSWTTTMTVESYSSISESAYDSGIMLLSSNWTTTMSISEPTPPTPPDEIDVPTDHYISIISMTSNGNIVIT